MLSMSHSSALNGAGRAPSLAPVVDDRSIRTFRAPIPGRASGRDEASSRRLQGDPAQQQLWEAEEAVFGGDVQRGWRACFVGFEMWDMYQVSKGAVAGSM